MSIRTNDTQSTTQPRQRDTQSRPAEPQNCGFTREELRQMVLELMG